MATILNVQMSERRRELMLTVLNERPSSKVLLTHLFHLDRITRCDELLHWLIKARLTGQTLIDHIIAGRVTPLELARFVIKRLNRDLVERPIIGGRDYIL